MLHSCKHVAMITLVTGGVFNLIVLLKYLSHYYFVNVGQVILLHL